ncbi:MAG: hypothetical protein KF862_18820 [Chitinophagaceae bacterium]|nr:hypothetical protein [Chitinophagaceae bacterium]
MLFLFLFLGIMILIGTTAYIFLSDEYKNNNTAKMVNIAGFALFAYFLFGSWRTLLNKDPVLVFTDNEFIIYKKGKPFSFSWREITNWKIEKPEDNGGYSLTIETGTHKENISLNWLEKPPQEIERLMNVYSKKTNTIQDI